MRAIYSLCQTAMKEKRYLRRYGRAKSNYFYVMSLKEEREIRRALILAPRTLIR